MFTLMALLLNYEPNWVEPKGGFAKIMGPEMAGGDFNHAF